MSSMWPRRPLVLTSIPQTLADVGKKIYLLLFSTLSQSFTKRVTKFTSKSL